MANYRDLATFAVALDKTAARVEEGAVDVMREAAKAVHSEVVEGTPVDTGRAAANWLISIGTPTRLVIEPHVPGRKGSTAIQNKMVTVSRGRTWLDSQLQRADQQVVISNNVDYIVKLNQGSSRQAPAGFVQDGVVAGVRSIKGARLLRR